MMDISIQYFTFRKQAPKDGLVNGLVTGFITYCLLYNYDTTSMFLPVGAGFFHSLIGTMLVPAIVLAFIISLFTTEEIYEKRVSGELEPILNMKRHWVKRAVSRGLVRALIYLLILLSIGWVVSYYFNLTLSQLEAALVAGILAFGITYFESVFATLRTFTEEKGVYSPRQQYWR
jgi:hypothetical protein